MFLDKGMIFPGSPSNIWEAAVKRKGRDLESFWKEAANLVMPDLIRHTFLSTPGM
jgi:hypothetical protein